VAFLKNLKKTKGFMRGLLIFFAAILTFGGPTYMMLILNEANLPRFLILGAGIVSLILGLALFVIILPDEKKSS
jgi:hypothetical protein